jgi:purine nucleosidase
VPRKIIAVAALGGIRDVPIAAGCGGPLIRSVDSAPYLHDGGGGGPALPLPTRALDTRHAVDVIIETLMREPPGTVTLVPSAALTNIAMAVRKEPRIVERVAEVVLMGGAVAGGNRTAAAESNIVTDPEAAHIGVTIADLRGPAPPDCHTQVAVDLDHARFWDLVLDALERIGEP